MSPARGGASLPVDSLGLLAATAGLGSQIEAALAGPRPEVREASYSNVVVFGMGGSGVAGAVASALGESASPVPIIPVSGYTSPAFVSSGTLAVAVSFSGETEETLSAASEAVARGAELIAITGGGSLASLAAGQGGRVLLLPPGIPQPRAGLGSMLSLLVLSLEEAGLLDGARRQLEEAATQLGRRIPELLAGAGPAVEIARRIGRTIPLVHGGRGLGEVAARRWKTQVNENAKAPAFSGTEPEVCHNELCGFGQSGDVTRQLLTLVSLHLGGEDGRIARRLAYFAELAGEALADHLEVMGEGAGPLAGFFDLVAIGDFVSLHLAAAEGVDPGPVPVLAEMKRRLGEQ